MFTTRNPEEYMNSFLMLPYSLSTLNPRLDPKGIGPKRFGLRVVGLGSRVYG